MTKGKNQAGKAPHKKDRAAKARKHPPRKPERGGAGAGDQLREMNEKLLRALAEAENVRRRAEREIQDAAAYAITQFARDMASVSDNLRRALAALPEAAHKDESLKKFIEGVEMTERELQKTFERYGIKRISPKGEPFDHNLHQAMFEVETDQTKPGHVAEVIQDGYVIKNRLLRPAMVGVAKEKAKGKGKEKQPREAK